MGDVDDFQCLWIFDCINTIVDMLELLVELGYLVHFDLLGL
jgi:hypothetical protein